jgi:hypothetical protein
MHPSRRGSGERICSERSYLRLGVEQLLGESGDGSGRRTRAEIARCEWTACGDAFRRGAAEYCADQQCGDHEREDAES